MGNPMRPMPPAPSLRRANARRLEELAGVLARRGIGADVVAPPGRVPRLELTHPRGTEHEVYAWRGQDGGWWYWWPWAERIAPDRDLDAAASAIEKVLGGPGMAWVRAAGTAVWPAAGRPVPATRETS
jgi:hypothetical protein